MDVIMYIYACRIVVLPQREAEREGSRKREREGERERERRTQHNGSEGVSGDKETHTNQIVLLVVAAGRGDGCIGGLA